MKVLVTGAAGFIGYHLCAWLLRRGHEVVGLDSLDAYYDVSLKLGRLRELGVEAERLQPNCLQQSGSQPAFRFVRSDICDLKELGGLFERERFEQVCNLAAQAGVRHSLADPHKYVQSNVAGFMNVLEACRHHDVRHLVYASSSSVYGLNRRIPFSTSQNTDHPVSIYAATKKSNELMAHSYSHLYGLPTTGLRFFTVYGPWGRPDMALFRFTAQILKGESVEVYNRGEMIRDFTYVADVVEGTGRILAQIPKASLDWDPQNPKPDVSSAPFRLFNIGNSQPVRLLDFIAALERELGLKARLSYQPMQPGDVPETEADVIGLEAATGFRPETTVQEGIRAFVHWYRQYYRC
jgi:UDP-glucuronate 4-epimerase